MTCDPEQKCKDKDIPIVKSEFVQCYSCLTWLPLWPDDGTGGRIIPLVNVVNPDTKSIEHWICHDCFDMIEEKCYDADLHRSLNDNEFYKMFLREVRSMAKKEKQKFWKWPGLQPKPIL